jgi:hypothetical protein
MRIVGVANGDGETLGLAPGTGDCGGVITGTGVGVGMGVGDRAGVVDMTGLGEGVGGAGGGGLGDGVTITPIRSKQANTRNAARIVAMFAARVWFPRAQGKLAQQ